MASNLPSRWPGFTALQLHSKISVREAAAVAGVHEDTFRAHYPHLIKRVGARRDVVTLVDALTCGEAKEE